MHITTINGKHLAFGLRWKPLLSATESYEALALAEADKFNATLIWQDGAAPLIGLYLESLPAPLRHQPVYAAAHVLSTVPGCGPNALLVIREQDGGHSICGIFQGRPWGNATASGKNFDKVGLSSAELTQLIQQFAELCGEHGYTLLGNVALADCNPFQLTELAHCAGPISRMYQPRRSVFRPYLLRLFIALGTATALYASYTHWQNQRAATTAAKLTTTQPLTPSSTALSQPLLSAPAMISAWFEWAKALPLSIGGWHLRRIDCTAHPPKPKCLLNYERKLPQATPQTFIEAATHHEAEQIDTVSDQSLQVSMALPSISTMNLQQHLLNLPSQRAIRLTFLAQLQRMQQVAETKLESFRAYDAPAGISPSALPSQIQHAAWEVNGPLHNIALFETFPASASFTQLSLTIQDPPPTTSLKASSLMLQVKGDIYARD
ncbi:MAG: Pilin accessory protein (PilO) [Glomeribacter sp. 1016415]|nr:Pilin accessory protein (PilO) [Glomeribacter sp. 1016415]